MLLASAMRPYRLIPAAIATLFTTVAALAQSTPPTAKPAAPAATGQPAAQKPDEHGHMHGQPPISQAQGQPQDATPQSITTPATPGEGPQVVFDTPTYEFGRIMAGDPIRHDFWFTNRGNAVLEIKEVKPSCGCTTAGQWDRTVEPGKTGKIPILLRTEKVTGEVQKTIRVTTNAPGSENVTLWLKGTVWQPVEVTPPYVNLGSVTDNAPHNHTVKIVNHLEEAIEIKNIKSDNPIFRAELKPVTPGKEFDLEITSMPPYQNGSNRATITMDTTSPKKPNITVTAMCYVPPAVEVNPRQLILPGGPLAQEMERAVYVNHNTPSPLKISDVQLPAKDVETRLVEDIPGKRFRIILKFPNGFTVPQDDSLKLTFKTDDATMPNVTVPVTPVRTRTPVAATPTQPPPYRQPINPRPGAAQTGAGQAKASITAHQPQPAQPAEQKPAAGDAPKPEEKKGAASGSGK